MLEQATASSMVPSLWSSLASWLTPTSLFIFLNLTIATIAITSKLHKNQNPESESNDAHDQYQHHPPLGRYPSNMLSRLKSISFYNNNPIDGHRQDLGRSPSNLLYRFKSINFYGNKPQEDLIHQEQEELQGSEPQQPRISRSTSVLQRLKSINFYSYFSHEHTVVSAAHAPASQETVTHFPPGKEDEDEWGHGESEDQVEDLCDRSLDEVYSKLQGKQQLVTRSKSDTKPTSGNVPTKLPKKMKKSASTKSAFSHFHESDVTAVEARPPATTREDEVKKESADDDHEVDSKADDFINRFKQQLKLQRIDSIIRYKEMVGRATGK